MPRSARVASRSSSTNARTTSTSGSCVAKPSVRARIGSKAGGQQTDDGGDLLVVDSVHQRGRAGLHGIERLQQMCDVVLMPGGLTLRSRPIGAVSIAAACSSQSTARRGLHTQAANASGHRQVGRQAKQRLANNRREEASWPRGLAVRAARSPWAGGSTPHRGSRGASRPPGSAPPPPSGRHSCSPALGVHRRPAPLPVLRRSSRPTR